MDARALAARVQSAMRGERSRVLRAFAEPAEAGRLKDDRTVVTDLDLALDRALGDALLAIDPAFGLVSEERGEVRPGRARWVLDPVDGTLNFSRRVPLFARQAALLEGDEALFGAIYDPIRDDFSWAGRGTGAWRDGRAMKVADRPPDRAVVLVDVDERGVFAKDESLLLRLRRSVYRLRSWGSIGLHLRDLAAGAADGVLGGREVEQPLHDTAPGTILVREAGGFVTDVRGRDALVHRGTIAAGGRAVHEVLLGLFRAAEGA